MRQCRIDEEPLGPAARRGSKFNEGGAYDEMQPSPCPFPGSLCVAELDCTKDENQQPLSCKVGMALPRKVAGRVARGPGQTSLMAMDALI